MESLLTHLIQSPKMYDIVREAQTFLISEKKKRMSFYKTITEQQKAEFINGEIIFHSPVTKGHNIASGNLFSLIKTFTEVNNLGFTGIEKIMISLTRNDYEPDICFFNADKASVLAKDQMQFPAPDFIVEVLSVSTEKNDRGIKFEDYASHDVEEYWIIDPVKQFIEQYLLTDEGEYMFKGKFSKGNIHSKAIKGFSIPVKAVFKKADYLKTLKGMLK